MRVFNYDSVEDVWGFGPEVNYEVGDTFEWAGTLDDVYCAPGVFKPYGTYKITEKLKDPYGRNWYRADLMPEYPMTEEDMRDIST